MRILRQHLLSMALPFRITIVDNASTDATLQVATQLANEFDEVAVIHTPRRGKGHAIALGWAASEADVLVFMDADLSVDLDSLQPLIAPLILASHAHGAADICVGSRYVTGARVQRGRRRTVVSRVYRTLVRVTLRTSVSDPPCGFKAIRRTTSEALLPLVCDRLWFFDTELLVLAERRGDRIKEIPVTWVEGAASRVNVVDVAFADLAGIFRMARSRSTHRRR